MTFAFLSYKTESSFLLWVCTVIDQSGTTEVQSSVPFVIRSDEGLTLETSAFKLFTVANLRYQLTLLYSPTNVAPQTLSKLTPFIHGIKKRMNRGWRE